MAIKLIPDVGVPAAVFAADWATSTYDTRAGAPVGAMKLNRPVGIGLCALGYAGAWLGWGGDLTKNLGIASFDWAANSLVSYFKERTVSSRMASPRMERIAVHGRMASPMGRHMGAYVEPQESYQMV